MTNVRAGHHGDLVYKFEDDGFDTDPTDSSYKVFGSNVTADTLEGGHNAARVFNADRYAANIISQLFDGAWSVSFDLSEPPWWLAGIFGQPTSANISGSLYDYTYDLTQATDPIPLRLYAPTDGFSNDVVYPGAVIASATIDQTPDGSPEVSLTGAYAREPFDDNSLSISIPSLGESTLTNRHAEVTAGGTTVGRAQNTNLSLEANTELINEIGSENAVDFVPRTFAPAVTFDKITWVGESVDVVQRFRDEDRADVVLKYDNGLTGGDEYSLDWTVTDPFPNDWSESGRNDPEADLMQELQHMGEIADVVVTTDAGSSGNPPGITL